MSVILDEKNSMDFYLADLKKIPLLTPKEEYALCFKILKLRKVVSQLERKLSKPQDNRRKLRNQLFRAIRDLECCKSIMVMRNCRLVIKIAKRYQNNHLQLADLIEEGNIGLIKAVEKFNPRKGYKFSTYAMWWIKQNIIKAIMDKGSIVRLPVHIDKQVYNFRRMTVEFENLFGKEPTLEELADYTSLGKDRINFMINIPKDCISFNAKINGTENELGEIFECDSNRYSATQGADYYSLCKSINKVLSKLSTREARIIELRFGLNGNDPLVLSEIGKKVGLTRERVRQLQKEAIEKLKCHCFEQDLNKFLEVN